jgi:hypothetical protein
MEEENEDSFEIRRPKSKSKKRQSLAPPPQKYDFLISTLLNDVEFI